MQLKNKKFKKCQVFSKYLALNFKKPITIFLGCFFPFMQAFISSVTIIYTNPEKDIYTDNGLLLAAAAVYYVSFIANIKRSAEGSRLGLILLVVFGAIGILCGKLVIS